MGMLEDLMRGTSDYVPPDWDFDIEKVRTRFFDHPKLKNLVPGMVLRQKKIANEYSYKWPKKDSPCLFVRYVLPAEDPISHGNKCEDRDIIVAVAVDKDNGDLLCFASDSSCYTVDIGE